MCTTGLRQPVQFLMREVPVFSSDLARQENAASQVGRYAPVSDRVIEDPGEHPMCPRTDAGDIARFTSLPRARSATQVWTSLKRISPTDVAPQAGSTCRINA